MSSHAGATSMSHQNKLWTSQISSGDTAVNGAGFMMAKQLLYCTYTNLPYPVEVGWIYLNAVEMKKGKELMTKGQMFNISSSTDLFFLGSGWLDVTDASFDDFWLLKCQNRSANFCWWGLWEGWWIWTLRSWHEISDLCGHSKYGRLRGFASI